MFFESRFEEEEEEQLDDSVISIEEQIQLKREVDEMPIIQEEIEDSQTEKKHIEEMEVISISESQSKCKNCQPNI